MQGRYQLEQQCASLSNLSNLLFKAKKPMCELQQVLNEGVSTILNDARIIELIGTWTPVWGPVVYSTKYETSNQSKSQSERFVPDNVAFVVKTTQFGATTYVISVAGTNSKSMNNICKQDLKVKPADMVKWEDVTKQNVPGKISLGTFIGLTNVLKKLIDINGIASTQLSLLDWIKTSPFESGSEIACVGHSLGAAISSSLAGWLAVTKAAGEVKISAYPTAGPTVGDKEWAEHTFAVLNGNFFGKMNSLDVVPLAWDRITSVKTIYEPYGLLPKLPVRAGLKYLASLVKIENSYHRGPGWTQFEGQFNSKVKDDGKAPFLLQIMYQHLPAYVGPLGYSDYFQLASQIYPQPVDPR